MAKKSFTGDDKVYVIIDGVRCYGTVEMVYGNEMCDILFGDGEDGTYLFSEIVHVPTRESVRKKG